MKILISSHAFAPHIGGIETVSEVLGRAFVARGHQVCVVTETPAQGWASDLPGLEVVRQATATRLIALARWADIVWHNNLSLRTCWPLLFIRRPFVITHTGSYCVPLRGLALALRAKQFISRFATCVAISEAMRPWCFGSGVLIPNPYDTDTFRLDPAVPRDRDLVFVGRLVSEKGIDLLLRALAALRPQRQPALTIVGTGPEEASLRELTTELGLAGQVTFAGALRGSALAAMLQRHRLLVAPSRYQEPFGVVALEGVACGCVVVGSQGGGLPEAIGPCGVTFPNGDVPALAAALESLLGDEAACERLRQAAPRHLESFQPRHIADAYLQLFEKLRARVAK